MPKRFQLEPYKDAQTQKWVLNIPPTISDTKKRQRLFYNTRPEAWRVAQRLKKRYARFGISLTLLSPQEEILASDCFRLLKEHQQKTGDKISLQAITIEYIAKYSETHASVSFERLIDEYIKARSYRTPRYLQKFIYIKKKFARIINQKVSQIERATIEFYLPDTSGARNSLIKHLSALFSFAIEKGYIPSRINPIDAIERAHVPPQEVEILSSEIVEDMLNYARKHSPRLLPYLVLGFYAGIRPNELTLLEGRDLLLEHEPKLVVIRPEVRKTRKKRFPELSDNAIAWMKLEPKSNLPNRKIVQLTEAQIIYARRQCYHAVMGNKPWVKTIMRHTYASHWLCFHEMEDKIDKLSLMLGHTSTEISLKHYYAAVTKEEAAKYFEIWPK